MHRNSQWVLNEITVSDNKTANVSPNIHYTQNHVRLSAKRPVRAYSMYPHPDVGLHDHDFHEIFVVVRGSAEQLIGETSEMLLPGSIFVLQPASQHALRRTRDLELININYLAEWFLTDIRALRGIDHLLPLFFEAERYSRAAVPPVVRLDATPDEFGRLMLELTDLIQAETSGRTLLYLESCFYKFLDELSVIYGRSYGRDVNQVVRPEVNRGLQLIEAAVAQRKVFSASQIAQQAGLSINRFENLFREHTGMSPTDYFQKHRVHHVSRRLLNSKVSIAEIAHDFNYADAAHLNRYFRRFFQMTPGEYRRRFAAK